LESDTAERGCVGSSDQPQHDRIIQDRRFFQPRRPVHRLISFNSPFEQNALACKFNRVRNFQAPAECNSAIQQVENPRYKPLFQTTNPPVMTSGLARQVWSI
jgi:hypothetical protein